jgi:DNA topoisomerase I
MALHQGQETLESAPAARSGAVTPAVRGSGAGAAGGPARKRAIARVVREVADYLGNTPAVARASYIDPRIIELYEDGSTIASVLGDLGKNCDFGDLATRGRAETAVVKLLARNC